MRIVVDGTNIEIYGPADRFSHCRFTEDLDATLHQAAVEQSLVQDGFTLETLTTERRAVPRTAARAQVHRGGLRAVPDPPVRR